MDFIERFFNLCPDDGSGLTEAALVVSVVLAVAIWWTLRGVRGASRRVDFAEYCLASTTAM